MSIPRSVLLLAAVHLSLFVYVALFAPMSFLLDDAYYSLTVAANIASGQGISYGGFATNGFQPLYTFILTPLFALLGEHRMACLKIALLFCGLCSTGSLLVLYRIAAGYAGQTAGVLAVGMGALSTNLLMHAGGGLETTLHALIFLLAVEFYTGRRNRLDLKDSLLLGLLLGVLALARLDACFVFFAVFADRFVVHRSNLKLALKENVVVFAPALLLLAPWFAWNASTFGTIAQSSGAFHHWRGIEAQGFSYALPGFLAVAAIKLLSLAVKLPLEPLTGYRPLFLEPARMLLGLDRSSGNFALALWKQNPGIAVLLAVAAIFVAVAVFFTVRKALPRLKSLLPLSWTLFALGGAALYYPLVLIHYSMRHYYAYSLLVTIPVAVIASPLLRRSPDGRLATSARNALLLGIGIIALFRCGPFDPKLPDSNDYGFARIEQIRQAIPAGASMGYTDCGFYGYFLPEYTVVNLDGILNFEAQQALRENRMSRYLVEKKVGYVLALDNLKNEYRRQFETDMLSVLEPLEGSDFIYRVKAP